MLADLKPWICLSCNNANIGDSPSCFSCNILRCDTKYCIKNGESIYECREVNKQEYYVVVLRRTSPYPAISCKLPLALGDIKDSLKHVDEAIMAFESLISSIYDKIIQNKLFATKEMKENAFKHQIKFATTDFYYDYRNKSITTKKPNVSYENNDFINEIKASDETSPTTHFDSEVSTYFKLYI